MTTINTNIASLRAIHQLRTNTADLDTSLSRLASGLRINTGKDDPAGLIASENLRAQIAGIEQVMENSSRANNFIGTAEGALHEISSLLAELQSLVVESANDGAQSTEELRANQLQVDAILASIDRISNATTFNGVKILNGTYEYTLSSVNTTNLPDLQVHSARVPEGSSLPVVVEVTDSAEAGELRFTGDGTSASNTVSIKVAGTRGSEVLSFTGSTAVSAMMAAINQFTGVTGVSATTSAGGSGVDDTLFFHSTAFGADAFVSVEAVEGGFATTNAGGTSTDRDNGLDATVLINGQSATVDGLNATVRTSSLDVELTLGATFGQTLGTTTFGITGGGADFQLSPHVDGGGTESLSIPSLSTGTLGRSDVGFLVSLGTGGSAALVDGNAETAQEILDVAIKRVAIIRGRLGSFQKTILEPNVNALQVTLENVTASESAIRDADFAVETSKLTRAQVLVQANTSVLSLANAVPQSVLALLQ